MDAIYLSRPADAAAYPAERSIGRVPSGIVIERLAVEWSKSRCDLYDQVNRSCFTVTIPERSVLSGHTQDVLRRAVLERLAAEELGMLA